MKIKREKILAMWSLFDRLSNEKCSVKFHYTVLKNKKIMDPEVEILRSANEPPANYKKFETERMQVCNLYCEKEEDGKPKVKDNNFIILDENREEFTSKLEELKEEYKEMFENMEKSQKEFEDLMSEDLEIDFVRIPMSTIPDSLTGKEVDIIFDLIDEDK